MQTAREYAISKGLAVPGRGKLSFDAHAAIQGFIDGGGKLSDWDKNGKISSVPKVQRPVVPIPKAVEKPRGPFIQVVDKQGVEINVGTCQAGHSIKRCSCEKVLPSQWLQSIAKSITVVGR